MGMVRDRKKSKQEKKWHEKEEGVEMCAVRDRAFCLLILTTCSSSVEGYRPIQHIIGHFGDNFFRPDDQTNSVKALKET